MLPCRETFFDPVEEVIFTECIECGRIYTLKCTKAQWKKFTDGVSLIQDVFPEATPGEREVFISGLCEKCFPEEEEDE